VLNARGRRGVYLSINKVLIVFQKTFGSCFVAVSFLGGGVQSSFSCVDFNLILFSYESLKRSGNASSVGRFTERPTNSQSEYPGDVTSFFDFCLSRVMWP